MLRTLFIASPHPTIPPMFTRRLFCGALLAGIGVTAWPASITAQQPAALPLRDVHAIEVVNAWEGYSPVSPTRATYTLARSPDGSFTGNVRITLAAGLLRRDTSFAIQLSRAAADSLLRVLSDVPLREGIYRPTFTHTDSYLSTTVNLGVGDSTIRFHTRSQGAAHVPWQVSAGGRNYVSGSVEILSSLGVVLALGRNEQRALIEAARADPEADCHRGLYRGDPQATPAQRPRYAAGEAWFTRDSTITVEGRRFRKYGLPRMVMLNELSPYATYRGVRVFKEAGLEGTVHILYVPVRSSCEVQPYELEP